MPVKKVKGYVIDSVFHTIDEQPYDEFDSEDDMGQEDNSVWICPTCLNTIINMEYYHLNKNGRCDECGTKLEQYNKANKNIDRHCLWVKIDHKGYPKLCDHSTGYDNIKGDMEFKARTFKEEFCKYCLQGQQITINNKILVEQECVKKRRSNMRQSMDNWRGSP